MGERGVSPCFHDWSHCKDRERRSGNTNARARAQGTEGGSAALAGSLSSVSWQSGIAGRATERPAGETEEQKKRLALYFCAGLVLAVALPRSTRITPLEHPTHFRYRNRNFNALVFRDTFLKAAKEIEGERTQKALLFFLNVRDEITSVLSRP